MSSNKRKNEELESTGIDQLNKRVALDSEQLNLHEKQEEIAQTAPALGLGEDEDANVDTTETTETVPVEDLSAIPTEVEHSTESITIDDNIREYTPQNNNRQPEANVHGGSYNEEEAGDIGDDETQTGDDETQTGAKAVSNHRERDNDPTYVLFRMYCPVKEASCIVGKKGEKINHIRDKANVRMNVSENLKNVPERIILVRGPAENVARAFGLIARTILDEPEDEPASLMSQQYNLKILVPHPMIGFIIGKQGLKFREIEENSAAKLKAAEHPLPYSTDRILSITGVGDAIHIAIYYISQVLIEHKDCLKKNKIVYYNTANYQNPNFGNNLMPVIPNPSMMVMGGSSPTNPLTMHGLKDQSIYHNQLKPQHDYGHQQQKQQYDFLMMFQPATHPQQHYGAMGAPPPQHINVAPPQNQYTDEHGNNIIGDVITTPAVQAGPSPDKFNQDVFVANMNIGSVIGKGGNNIKQIREKSGCTYVKIEPDRGQSIMLGGGKGLTNIRKLTLTGSPNSIQMAIYLINQRIIADKERNAH